MADSPPYPDPNRDTGDVPGAGPGRGSTRRSRRWVNVLGIIALVLILLFAVWLLASGGHGPGRHTPSGDARGYTRLSIGDVSTGGVPGSGSLS
jgi:hypothetical protein